MACEIDWTATGTMLAGIGSYVGAAATAFGGWAVLIAAKRAADTFTAWKQQKREERRMELAEQILALSYRIRHAMTAIRSPASFGGEHDAARKKLEETNTILPDQDDAYAKRKITAQIVLLRLSHHQKMWDQLSALAPTTKAVFGNAMSDELEKFWTLQGKVHSGAIIYAQLRPQVQPTPKQYQEDPTFERELERAFWAIDLPEAPDEIAANIEAIIANLEAELSPIIREGVAT